MSERGQQDRTLSTAAGPRTLAPPLMLSSFDATADDAHASHSVDTNHSTFSLATDTSGTPTRRGSAADHVSGLSRSAGVTSLLRPAKEAPPSAAANGAPRASPPTRHSPNTSPRATNSSLVHSDWAVGSEFAGAADAQGGLRTVEGSSTLSTSALPVLASASFIGAGNSSRSVGGATTPPPPGAQAAPTVDTSVTGTSGLTSVSPGRSMTLLERRNNRERSMMSISCLSGLNVETIQASMRDTTCAVAEGPHKTTPPTRGWSKTVASAALLGDYEVPRLNTAGSAETSGTAAAAPAAATAQDTEGAEVCAAAASPAASKWRQAPATSPAFRSTGTNTTRRGCTSLSLNPDTAAAPAVTPSAPRGSVVVSAPPKKLDAVPGALKVVSYNILASRLASTDLYPHCAPSVLSEEYRVGLVKEELRQVDPDLLLMEEISVAVHEESLGPFLKSALGLEGHHAVVTDRLGHPRCSTRPPTATDTSPRKGSCSTRKKFDGLSLAALCGTSATCTTPATPASGSSAGRASSEQPLPPQHVNVDGEGGESYLPPLVRAGSITHPALRCGSGTPTCAPPPVRRKGSRTPQPGRGQPSLSSMGNTQTTVGTVHGSATTPLHGDVLQRSSSALELTSIMGARAAQDSAAGLMSPQKASSTHVVASPLESPSSHSAGGIGGGAAGAENHRRIEMDGVAVYYKASRFRLLEVVPVYFNAIAAVEDRLTPYEHQKLQVNSHNVALVVVLHDTQVTGASHVYIVAAVHFIWQRINAQLWQAHQLLRVIEDLKSRYSKGDVDLAPLAAMRRSVGLENLPTQPPSLAETPLHNDLVVRPGVRRELPRPSSPGKRPGIPQRPTTATPESVAEANGSVGRRESVVSNSTNPGGGVVVTCLVGGDFNSERSGPVMEYLRTGRVPENASVMDYWKAPVPHTPPHRRPANTAAAKADGAAAGAAKGESVTHAAFVAHTPPERFPRVSAPKLDISTLPQDDHSGGSSPDSPPSPTQPSMQPRRQTQSPPPTLDMDDALSQEGTGQFLLQPYTPPRQRQPQQPFAGRTRELPPALLVSPKDESDVDDDAAEERRRSSAAVMNSAPSRVGGGGATAAAPPTSAEESIFEVSNMSNFRFGRGSASLNTSPVSGSLVEPAERGAGESGSVPTIPVNPPPPRVLTASAAPPPPPLCCGCSRSRDRHPSPLPNKRAKASTPGSLSNVDHPFHASPASTSRHSRRRTSPEALRSEESSALLDWATGNKSASRSHSTSGFESVLSTQLASAAIPMKLALHSRHGTPSPETSDGGWASEGSPQPQPQQATSSSGGSPAVGQLRKLTPPLQSPSLFSPAENAGTTAAAPTTTGGVAAEKRIKPLPAFAAATLDGGAFDAFIQPSFGQADNFDAPPAPKAGAKRRSLNEAANTMSGTSTNGTCCTPPMSPRASRRRAEMAGAGGCTSGTASLTGSTEVRMPHQLQQPQNSRDASAAEVDLSPSSSVSTSSHGAPWPEALEEATPCKPAQGLIDDVAHAIRFSDAYAPYCYRHPSRVSAMNPSTNMEGKVLDHILYEDEHVVCGGVLRLGEKEELPNARVPSDHYMIGAVLVPIQELHRAC